MGEWHHRTALWLWHLAVIHWRNVQPRQHRNAEAHRKFMERVGKMTPHEVFLSSVEAGIHYADGRLRPPYDGSSQDDAAE